LGTVWGQRWDALGWGGHTQVDDSL